MDLLCQEIAIVSQPLNMYALMGCRKVARARKSAQEQPYEAFLWWDNFIPPAYNLLTQPRLSIG